MRRQPNRYGGQLDIFGGPRAGLYAGVLPLGGRDVRLGARGAQRGAAPPGHTHRSVGRLESRW